MKTTKQKALEILKVVCKKGCTEKAYKGLQAIKTREGSAIEVMIKFFEPVDKSVWIIHFVAFLVYLDFLQKNENDK